MSLEAASREDWYPDKKIETFTQNSYLDPDLELKLNLYVGLRMFGFFLLLCTQHFLIQTGTGSSEISQESQF